jgi:hypothetical protein
MSAFDLMEMQKENNISDEVKINKISKLYHDWDSFKISSFDAMAMVGEILQEREESNERIRPFD